MLHMCISGGRGVIHPFLKQYVCMLIPVGAMVWKAVKPNG